MLLGVNIDHIAVLREARKINDPNPLDAVSICKLSGADQITIHLREDRRHIHDDDAKNIIKHSALPINLECSLDDTIIDIVCALQPHRATLVPEKREEVTTEGGLDVEKYYKKLEKVVEKLHNNNIEVSLFIDPNQHMIELANKLGVKWIELHTGTYANIYAMLFSGLDKTHHSIASLELPRDQLSKILDESISSIIKNAELAYSLGLKVAAGHGLNYQNVAQIVTIDAISELNIGQSIVARSVFVGLENAIKEMKKLVKKNK